MGRSALWLAAQRAFDVPAGQLFSVAMRGRLSEVNDPSGSAEIQAG